ncbi:MAG: PIN domain-containing protein [Acidobacteriota bacterium]
MRQVLVDTNVVLDVLLDRRLHVEASAAVWAAVEMGVAKGFLAAHAVTTVHYLIRKELGNARAARTIAPILRVFEIAPVDRTVLEQALQRSLPDFEDSVTAGAALLAGCDFIVTRHPKGFRGSPVRPVTPEAFLPLL